MVNKQELFRFIIAILVFVVASLAYFSPVLEGKRLSQSDIAQFRGVSKEISEFRTKNKQEPYWTNRAFGGMPAYQLSAYYPNNYIKKADNLLRFLPRPADYLFLYFLGFYVLLFVLKVEWKLAILGALAFGFSTYLIIIFGAGHNAKAHAIAYMPLVLAGILLVFKKKYLPGFLLTAIAMALEINASHPQMTYYLLFMVLIMGLVYLLEAIKLKALGPFLKKLSFLAIAVVIALGLNATGLLATIEYADNSTRSKSELTIKEDGSPKKEQTTGLTREYITQYSYGPAETFNIMIPRFYGGGSREKLGKDSETYSFLKDKIGRAQAKNFSENFPGYWGEQTIVEAPAYIGSILIFLFVMGLFLIKGKLKNWLLGATVFSILLSWGRHFPTLTNFFIDYVPLYNKFRAVSSMQVIAELAVPLLAVLTLDKVLRSDEKKENVLRALKYSLYGVGGICLVFTLFGTSLFNFESFRDEGWESQLAGISEVFISDRKTLFFQDSLRSFLLIVFAALIIWGFIKQKVSRKITFFSLAALILFDLVAVDKRYINAEDFISKQKEERPFQASDIDKEILKDKSYYRVANFTVDPMNDGSTSYFHNSIGGYHAAKPRRYEELFYYHIAKNNFEVLNMLNTKYIIYPDNEGQARLQQNPEANGNAWFVNDLEFVSSADQEITALDSLNTKEKAVVRIEFKELISDLEIEKDSLAFIELKTYAANELKYESSSKSDQIAVFSDIYYPKGWQAYLDGNPVEHFRVNFVLRAMNIPAGRHEIIFRFEPEVIKKGNSITLVSYGLLFLLPLGLFFLEKRRGNESSQ